MTGLSALNLPQPLVWIVAFAIIFGLLAAFAHLLKRIAGSRAAELEGGRNRLPRLGLVDSFDLDRHRKLLIVRRDNVEHLLLVGPTDVVVESNIVRAAGAVPLREDRAMVAPVQAPAAAPTPPGPAPMPIPPAPATPGSMQAPAPQPVAAPPAPPVMPQAPFPVAPSRSEAPRKTTMPPPPPYGAPKRGTSSGPARVEPVLGIPGVPTPAEKPLAVAEPVLPLPPEPMREVPPAQTIPAQATSAQTAPAKADLPKPDLPKPDLPKPDLPKSEAPKVDLPKAEIPKAETPKSEPQPVAPPAEQIKVTVTVSEPVPNEPKSRDADPLLADLSSKLQEVLKSPPRAEPAAERPPLPPLPPLPPVPTAPAKPAIPPAPPVQEVAMPTPPEPVVELALNPEPKPAEAVAPPPPAADAFEEELRRILGRVPPKN